MTPESNTANPPILNELSQITETPVGIASSYFQESVCPSDWMRLLSDKGLNPTLHKKYRQYYTSPFTHSPVGLVRKASIEAFKTDLNMYGHTILEKSEAENTRRGVNETGYCNISVDANTLEQSLNAPRKLGEPFIEGLEDMARMGAAGNIWVKFFVNQFAGLPPEAINNKQFTDDRFHRLQQRLPGSLDTAPVNNETVNFHDTIDKVKEFGGRIFRSSLELGRIFPEEGRIDEQEYNNLKDWIGYAKSNGISPMLCLHHFTMPHWMKGGWSNPENGRLYTEHSLQVLERLKRDGAMPDTILTENEPQAVVSAGEVSGDWPPFHKSDLGSLAFLEMIQDPDINTNPGARRYTNALDNAVQAHIDMYHGIKQFSPETPVGFTYNLPMLSTFRDSRINNLILDMIRDGNNAWFKRLLNSGKQAGSFPADFVGLQYYNEFEISVWQQTLNDAAYAMKLPISEDRLPNGWKRHPDGAIVQMMHISRWLMEFNMATGNTRLPQIAITETGVPSNVDQTKGYGELHVLAEAVKTGSELIPNEVPFSLIWSLKDNLEWSSGMTPCFGLLKSDGSFKPEATIPAKPLDLSSPTIKTELNRHIKTMAKYKKHLESMQQLARNQQELDVLRQQTRMIEAKLQLANVREKSLPTKFLDI